ncbi:MAG: hypothetical protein MHPSP_000449 [Paramarteilia canceri]
MPTITEELHLYNSLTRRKEVFKPRTPGNILWYCCGPTVYDHSHVGHARTYLTQDIIRRILAKFFNYNVTVVMNITDVDDKIINRARRNFLLDNFMQSEQKIEELSQTFQKGLKLTNDKLVKNKEGTPLYDVISNSLLKAEKSFNSIKSGTKFNTDMTDLQAIISESLDHDKGHEINDKQIFKKFAEKFEKSFHEDCQKLNIIPPTVITRCTEYIEEMIEFIDKIMKNGYAYVSNGSVYFDIRAFTEAKFKYPQLMPEMALNLDMLAEGEGALSMPIDSSEKKLAQDFVLWKSALPGQPSWPSPWGDGRPGWHIECSAMCQSAFGNKIDIHSGGIDLKFPHHDNEIAQCEAYNNIGASKGYTWSSFWLHPGHLNIKGLKMSKSLKNFITIKEILEEVTPNQLRLLFMNNDWNSTSDYSEIAINVI